MGNRMDSASPIGLLIEAYKSLGLSINIKNPRSYTAPDNIEGTPDVNISGITLEVVEYFPYLGVIYPRRRPLKQKFNTVYAVTAHSFRKLRHRLFDNHNPRKDGGLQSRLCYHFTLRDRGIDYTPMSSEDHVEIPPTLPQKGTLYPMGRSAPMPVSSWRPTQLVLRQW